MKISLRAIAVGITGLAIFFGGVGVSPFSVKTVAASAETEGAWNGLDQSEIIDSPYVSSSLKKRIGKLSDNAQEDLPIPVLFGVSPAGLTDNYGDARSGGRTHEGLDIMAPKGAPIVSPTKAVVLSVGTGASSGNTVSTANPGGETFVYMHLDRIADIGEGDMLDPGDLIGYCGNTGNASGGATHLHFEIHLDGATDPYSRLSDEFSLGDKMKFTTAILEESEDAPELAQFLADNYSDQFVLAQSEGIDVPEAVKDVLAVSAHDSAGGKSMLLAVGSSGIAVKTLQTYLIGQGKGAAARALSGTGATGYFGPLTYAALAEYQAAAGIPVSGNYTVPEGSDNFFANLDPDTVSATNTVKTAKIEELKANIAQLQAQIVALQQKLLAAASAPSVPAISVDIKIANISKNSNAANSVNIGSGDMLKFQISVANSGTAIANDIIVRNNFPAGITSWNNVLMEGGIVSGALDKELKIGSLASGQKKTITCTAKVSQAVGDTLIDIAVAYNDDIWGRATAQVVGEL